MADFKVDVPRASVRRAARSSHRTRGTIGVHFRRGSWLASLVTALTQCSQCRDGDDPHEIRLGMDTYCLMVDPGQATHYGGVRECELDGGRLRLTLTEEAAGSLGMPADVTLALDLTPQQVDLLSRGLARVLTSGRADAIPQRLRV
jgi:hypothetical protein